MDYKKILEILGYKENVDFKLLDGSFVMIEKKKQVVRVENGNTLPVEEITYTERVPTNDELNRAWGKVRMKGKNIPQLISEYLVGKESLRDLDDSYNAHDDEIIRWDFSAIPKPSVEELLLLEPEMTRKIEQKKVEKDRIEIGLRMRKACEQALNYIAGYNHERELTDEQIGLMQTQFYNIQLQLMSLRPRKAYEMILAINPDGVIITQDFKNEVLSILAGL